MRFKIVSGLASLCLLLAGGLSLAQTLPPPQPPAAQAEKAPAPEPDPRQVLHKMCDFLRSQPQFTYKAEVAEDQVYAGGKKLQYGMDMETMMRRPDRLRVNAEGDLVHKQFFFDGKSITLYDREHNVYGVMAAPADIEGALEKANRDFGLRVALSDLASPNLCELINKRVEHPLYVGLHKVRGVPSHHLSFDSEGAQLQVWVDAGEKPVPRKVVLTYKQTAGAPPWSAYITDWNCSP
jgi:hypothetical protein